jgi:hypothetical protein
MANIYGTPVMFAKQNNVVFLFARVTFGATGVPTLDTTQSKGVCAVTENYVPFTGGVVNSTTIIGTVTSFNRLFTGMTVTGTGVQTTNLISSMSGAGKTITMTKQNITTGDEVALTANGGQFTFQFGNKSGVNLDTYNKLLMVDANWDMTSASASGSGTVLQLAPAAPQMFVLGSVAFNQRSIPASSASGSTDATIQVQFGSGQGTSFSAYKPVAGESVRMLFIFGNSGGGNGYNG